MKRLKKLIEQYKNLDKKKKSYLIAIASIIFVMLWAFISAGIITGGFNREMAKNGADEQKVNAAGIIITNTKEGTKYFEIYGETGYYNNKEKVAILNNVVGNFYKNNEVYMSFQSSKGSYDEINEVITLYENSYVILKDETSLEADEIVWSGSDKDTIATGHVRIRKGKELLANADKCVIGAGYEKFKIIGKTTTKIFEKNKEN